MIKSKVIFGVMISVLVAMPAFAADSHVSPIALVAAKDGKTVYVAGHTAGQVAILDVAKATTRLVPVPGCPTGLALADDGNSLFVSVAGPAGGVHVVDLKMGTISGSLPTGHTPMAPVLSPDGNTLYVCNRFDNDVSVIKLKGAESPVRIAVTREPVAAALTPDGKFLFVANLLPDVPASSAYVAASVSVIDTAAGKVSATLRLPNGSSSLRGICVSPDGKYGYVTHTLGRYQIPPTQVDRGWMNTSALTIIDTTTRKLLNTVLLDDTELGAANPWGVACTADGKYICVAHAGTHELSVIEQTAMLARLQEAADPADVCNDLAFLVGIRRRLDLSGNGPRDLVMIGTTAYAAEYFSDSIGVLDINPDASPEPKAKSVPLGPEIKDSAVRKGERLFHDAKLCFQQWQSCTTCHPDSRVDGLNWDLLNDGMGNPKNTRNMLLCFQTPPSMSLGIRESASAAVRAGIQFIQFAVRPEEDALAIDEYVKSMQPVPSPHLVKGELSDSARRGKEVFTRAGCADCHPAPLYTDLKEYNLELGDGQDKDKPFDTPTLVECWRTAPYLHDGRAYDMKEVFSRYNPKDLHGRTKVLSPEELNDLIEFVLSL